MTHILKMCVENSLEGRVGGSEESGLEAECLHRPEVAVEAEMGGVKDLGWAVTQD